MSLLVIRHRVFRQLRKLCSTRLNINVSFTLDQVRRTKIIQLAFPAVSLRYTNPAESMQYGHHHHKMKEQGVFSA